MKNVAPNIDMEMRFLDFGVFKFLIQQNLSITKKTNDEP